MLDNGPDVLDIGLRREIGTDEFAPAREAGRATEGHDMVFNAVPEDQQKIMARAFDAPLQLKAVTTLGGFEKRGDLGNSGLKGRSEEHTSELQSLMRISYAVFCLKKKNIENAYK